MEKVFDQVYGSNRARRYADQLDGIIGRIELQLPSSVESKSAETLTGAIPSGSVASPSALQMPDFAGDFHIRAPTSTPMALGYSSVASTIKLYALTDMR